MPRAIADSDDDEDDLFAETNHAEPSALMPDNVGAVDAEVTVNNFTDEQSTGSTERLRRQIEIAERGLLTNSTSVVMPRESIISSDSPSVRATKRRHTSVAEVEEIASSERSVKRTKTSQTYGSKRQSNILVNDSTFQRLMEDEAGPLTSQSAHFSEHSGVASSAALPSGHILDDFLNHEPNLLFQDSGSTVADTSSAQQRLLAQTRAKAAGSGTLNATNMISNEAQNSSVPFSTIGDNNDANFGGQPMSLAEITTSNNGIAADTSAASATSGAVHDTVDPRELLLPPNDGPTSEVHTQVSQIDSRSKRVLSPAVEIPRNEAAETKPDSEAAKPTKQARLGRIRKANANEKAAAPVSDDRPVGLPPEQYKPRPSKRRANPVDEDPIDYSVRPEKAAKAKRRRTDSIGSASGAEKTDQDVSFGAGSSTASGAKIAVPVHENMIDDTPEAAQQTNETAVLAGQGTASKNNKAADIAEILADRSEGSEIAVVPAQLTQKSKIPPKSKRSRTATFENHVESNVSQGAPEASQQKIQEKRPLQELENEAKPTQRKRRNVIVDDDDDDESDDDGNELAKAPETVQEEAATKKRGRGRPAKSTAKIQPDVTVNVSTDVGDCDENQPSTEAPQKAGRGRPAKASVSSKSAAQANNGIESPPSPLQQSNKALANQTKTQPASQTKSTETAINRSSGELPTPSPEKQNSAKKDPVPKATSRPDKGTSKVQYRVGLSQRARIPPLHRNIKPQKR